jgi:hypothetical protein
MNGIRFMPSNDKRFLDWADHFRAALAPLIELLGFPPANLELITALRNTFAAALALADAPATRTAGTIAAKNTARKALEQTLRQSIREYLTYNHLLTDQNREDLGLPIHSNSRTPVPVPTTTLTTKVSWPAPGVVEIAFRDSGIDGHAKPYGVHGAEFIYEILDTPPTQWHELTHSVFDTRSPIRLSFENDQRKRSLYFAARWENNRGEKGPWSEIRETSIP